MITLYCLRPKAFNVGNDVIFAGLRHFVQEAFQCVVNLVTLPATSRYESVAKAGLTPRTIHEINQYGHGVIVGGGNLYENGELEVNLDALEQLQVPMMLFSLSKGRVYSRNRKLVPRTDSMPARNILGLNRKALVSLARDEATHSQLIQMGVEKERLVVGGCPTIFLDRMVSTLPTLSSTDQEGVFISIRTPDLMNIPLSDKVKVYRQVEEIIGFLRGQGHQKVRLLCHDHRDIPFAASFQGIDYVYTDDCGVFLALLKAASLVVTYRLHAVLPCLSFGTPAIAISYDERATSLIKTIGFDDWNIKLVESPDLLAEVMDRHRRLNEIEKIRERAKPRWDELYATMSGAFRDFAVAVNECARTSNGEEAPAPLRKSA
ncbi:MAG: hypothetical protein EXS09_18140 [Gemmataceae bacterium]|nr:hypothetical protein [Gemmataceae bacterium]